MPSEILLVANGDARPSVNQAQWAAQQRTEEKLEQALAKLGAKLVRAHEVDPSKQHGFIDSESQGTDVLQRADPAKPLIVCIAGRQVDRHILAGLKARQGPLLTISNWDGRTGGIPSLLDLNGALTRAGISYTTLWSEDFTDAYFIDKMEDWLAAGYVRHSQIHVKDANDVMAPHKASLAARELVKSLQESQAVLGLFDEEGLGPAGIPDELLAPTGITKQRLLPGKLLAGIEQTPDAEAQAVRDWVEAKGLRFEVGADGATELTDAQILEQCKLYIATLRLAEEHGCAAIGAAYRMALADGCASPDLAEGLCNNVDRPPVTAAGSDRVLFENQALPNFHDADECAGLDALITHRLWAALGFEPETASYQIRWGAPYEGRFVWTFCGPGSAPPQHLAGGYAGIVSKRQNPIDFPKGGGALGGVAKPGLGVWSRLFVEDGKLKADLGVFEAIELPAQESERRSQQTVPHWPLLHAVLPGIDRDKFMGRHKSGSLQIVYVPGRITHALGAKLHAFRNLGIECYLCGEGHDL